MRRLDQTPSLRKDIRPVVAVDRLAGFLFLPILVRQAGSGPSTRWLLDCATLCCAAVALALALTVLIGYVAARSCRRRHDAMLTFSRWSMHDRRARCAFEPRGAKLEQACFYTADGRYCSEECAAEAEDFGLRRIDNLARDLA